MGNLKNNDCADEETGYCIRQSIPVHIIQYENFLTCCNHFRVYSDLMSPIIK